MARFETSDGLRPLRRADLPVDTVALARYLLGKTIVHDTANGRLSGRIVETGAYPVGDAAGMPFGAGQQALDVNHIISETVALLRDEAMRHSVLIRTELVVDLHQIVGDGLQLQQVMMNLILNSIEAMKNVDGTREIIIQSQRDQKDQIRVSFSDTGIGLPRQLAEKIFDPFFTTKPHGTGMGRRISRSIIEAHGGRLWAVNPARRGATFQFSLPVAIEN